MKGPVVIGTLFLLGIVTFFLIRPRYVVHKEGAVLLTGASTGIGKDAALELAKAGYHVFAGVRKEKDGKALVEEGSHRIHPVILDVTSSEQILDALKVVESFTISTGLPFVGLVNNAGVAYGDPVEFLDMDRAHWLFDVNYFGLIEMTKEAIPLLIAHQGRIVNIGSVAGLFSGPYNSIYSGSKYAVEAVTDASRRELKSQGVSVSLIEPAFVATPIFDKQAISFENLPQDARESYGIDEYVERMMNGAAQASPTSVTSEAVLDALANPYPSTRYVVANIEGTPACVAMRLIWLLPSHITDKLF